jgi:SRSO17 transposase
MERLLYQVKWDPDAARDRLEDFVIEKFQDPEGIGVLDETGFLKKGESSVGVQRQYTGTAGKVENSQVGVFLTYATAKGHVFLDRRIFLPEEWANDLKRRTEAGVPDSVAFQTKPQQGVSMLEHAWKKGVPMKWVTGDEVYGDSPQLREAIETSGRWYVLAVASTTEVWTQAPCVEAPGGKTRGRRRTKPHLCPDAAPSRSVASIVAEWPAERWKRFSVAQGEKGLRVYDWAMARVIEKRDKLPGPEVWLLARRSVSNPEEIAYYLAFAPADITLQKLAEVASTRYTVEQCFEEGKGETGLDHYEVRHYFSWYRHITLSMMAHAWLSSIHSEMEEKRGTLSLAA